MSGNVARCSTNVLRGAGPQWFVDYLPITGGNQVELFVDGEGYGQSLLDALAAAQRQVLLTGLHFDPDWQLTRARGGGSAHSLLNVLRGVAQRGVDIYLIVNQFWRDEIRAQSGILRGAITRAGHLDWYLPKTIRLFDGLRSFANVHCRTDVHRGFVMSTHHQKTVVIDETVAYVGGIDLTAVDGDRWDTNRHVIAPTEAADVRNAQLPEKLWHDVHMKLRGPAVRFVLDNFHARWNHGRLLKNLVVRTHQRVVHVQGVAVSWEERYLHAEEDRQRHLFGRIADPGGVYQNLTRVDAGAPAITSRRGRTDPIQQTCGPSAVASLAGTKIQVVRSMPQGEFVAGRQKPAWNLSTLDWERSAKDAYLVGIRAARQYVYLENQWVSDEHIWAELERAARRNRGNPNFRILVMLPRNPLAAAGYGTNQDVDLSSEVNAVVAACASAAQFGMYCIVAPIPSGRRASLGLSPDDIARYGDSTAQIYVHSKVLVVDDQWALIGSANAGGISLEGVSNPGATYRGATPDSELSAIIYDEAFARQFRQTLWAEHLEDPAVRRLNVPAAADLFRSKASANRHRVRFAGDYAAAVRRGGDAVRRVPASVVQAVQQSARIVSSRGSAAVPLAPDQVTTFAMTLEEPGQGYTLHYRWSLRDSSDGAWLLRGLPSDRVVQHYGPEPVAYIPSRTAETLRGRIRGRSAARMLCRIMVTPAGVAPRRSGADQDRYSVLVELPITLDGT
ncbi:MAG: hypothetical protein JXQ29_08860 [Planctomycetes bacterium]|nr:hypothetical protein [Planctomycetota bacterium]